MKRRPGQRGIPSVTSTDDAYPIRIDNALGDEVGDTVQKVGLHLAAPFVTTRPLKRVTEPGGAAELGLEDRIAPRGHELGPPIELEVIPSRRSAMREHDKRQPLGIGLARRKGQVGRNGEAVIGLVAI